ncbi:phosphatase PAP2 family protein [Treponema primitia]|uniref:phosphatase PAP2 family protein n=1 Tax=Treponema primitia TaxID=88058 RepID=UPI00397F7AB8
MTEAIISNAEVLPPLFAIYRWGIDLIQHIQGIQNPGFTAFIRFVTALGTEYFYIPVVLLIFWCIDEKKGARLGFLIIFSALMNGFFKELLKQPRPFTLEPSVGLAFEPSYGIPSGHAQLSLCFWLPLALWISGSRFVKSPRQAMAIRIGAVLFILLIAFTRLYLGVHFPTDILAGWLLGGLTLGLWFALEPRVTAFLDTGGLRARMIAAAIIALGMISLYPSDRSLGGLFLGFGAGYALMLQYFPFAARPGISVAARCLRYILGFAGGVLIYRGFKVLFPGQGSIFSALPYWGAASPFYELGRFVRYGLLGLWASAGAPRLFLRFRLAEPQ